MADSSGILESNISALLNDTSTITLEFGLKKGASGQLFHSIFSDLPINLAEPLIRKYANQLHGFTSGEITFTKVNRKLSLEGEIRLREASLRVIPLNARFSFPDEKIVIKKYGEF